MSYHPSFYQTLQLLQFTFTPNDYVMQIEKYRWPRSVFTDPNALYDYWDRLPTYLIAQCPLCGAQYTSVADTHGIFYWLPSCENDTFVFTPDHQNKGCKHFTATQIFLNLHGQLPTEATHIANNSGDVPVVVPELLMAQKNTCAVMHSLPVCRIEGDKFVPKYSIYIVTYYSEDPGLARMEAQKKLYPEHSAPDRYHWGTLLGSSNRMWRERQVADLSYWVEQHKLFWLDISTTQLALESGPSQNFPYSNIQGYGRAWTYWHRPKPKWLWQQWSWAPEGKIEAK